MGVGENLSAYRVTRFQFARERPIGDSQIRLDQVHVAAVELIDEAGRVGLGFAQSLVTPLPDVDEIERVFAQEAWPSLVGQRPVALALSVKRARGGNVRQMGLPFEKGVQDAMWDLLAKQMDLPLWRMLGASAEPAGLCQRAGLSPDRPRVRRAVRKRRRAGYRAFKIKVGHPGHRARLAPAVAAPRATGGRGAVMIDANEAWTAQGKRRDPASSKGRAEDILGRGPRTARRFRRIADASPPRADPYQRRGISGFGGKRRLLESRACDMLNIHGHVGDGMQAGWLANDSNVEVTLGNTFLEIGVNWRLLFRAFVGSNTASRIWTILSKRRSRSLTDSFTRAMCRGTGFQLSETARRNSRPKLEPLPSDEPASWRSDELGGSIAHAGTGDRDGSSRSGY